MLSALLTIFFKLQTNVWCCSLRITHTVLCLSIPTFHQTWLFKNWILFLLQAWCYVFLARKPKWPEKIIPSEWPEAGVKKTLALLKSTNSKNTPITLVDSNRPKKVSYEFLFHFNFAKLTQKMEIIHFRKSLEKAPNMVQNCINLSC